MDEKLKNAIAEELQEDPASLTPDRLVESISLWDSATALTVTVMIGDFLGFPLEPGDMLQVKTFGDLEGLVRAKQQRR
jgi:acyl carrier protein